MSYNRSRISGETKIRIKEGFIKYTLKPGDRLPLEDQFAAQLRAVRATVRTILEKWKQKAESRTKEVSFRA